MVHNPEKRSAFVLRIWREEDEDRVQTHWRGWIQHVSSGEEAWVHDMAGLIGFIEQHAGKLIFPDQVNLK